MKSTRAVLTRNDSALCEGEFHEPVDGPATFTPIGFGVLSEAQLLERIGEANAEIYLAGHNQPYYYGMGTTLVVAWFYDNLLTVAHLGDSRAYRLRKNCFERLTRDHSLLQQQVDSGIISAEDARWSIGRNLVTQALGVNVTVAPEIKDFPVEPGDLYLLCSDGLTEMLDDMEIGRTLEILGANVGAAAEHLVKMANDNGGPDNVSVILIRVRGEFPAGRTGKARWQD